MDWQELGFTAARAVLVYVVMLFVIRVLGKRTIGNFTAFDLLVALMLGEVVDEIIYGDVDLAQGFTAIFVIAACKYATAWIGWFSHRADKILEGAPREVVRHGEFVRDGMKGELVNELEVYAALRLKGVSDMREVRSAFMEVDGQISVLLEPWAEALQKRDLGKRPAPERAMPADGPSGEEKRTDAPQALGLAR
jgi:uncharacterized membrane protein YcaP (DUF421 family)